jgi:carboxyl-terminal processing protease
MRSNLANITRAALLVGAVALLPVTTAGLAAVDSRATPQIGRLLTVWQLIRANYVEPVDDEKIEKGAIEGMLAALDPHSSYLEGASLAEKVGIKPGDYITHLDGKLIYGSDLDEAVAKMRGEAGTSIRLTIFRTGRDEPFDVTVTRGVIDLEPVTWKLEGATGVITVNEFSRNVGNDVNVAIQAMKRQSAGKLAGLILDLRSNPGGSLDEAVALSDLFLEKGDIVSQRGRIVSENEYYRAESVFRGDAAKGLPIVLLIDAGSASASEIVAGALQDQHRALIMGERSFGKGSVQSMIRLDRTHAVKLTTARYYTPNGRSVQEGGIEPDIRVPQISDPDARKRAEMSYRESDLRRHLVNEAGLDDKKLETDKQDDPRFKLTADQLKAKGITDFQLYYALETLRRAAGTTLVAPPRAK